MSFVVSPFVALGVWAVVALTGSIVSSFILLVLSWNSEKQKSADAVPEQTNRDVEEDEVEREDEELTPASEEMEMQTEETESEERPEMGVPRSIIPETGFLLPPRMEGDPRHLTVVLDLDETLVRSCEAEDVPMQLEFAASLGLLQRLEIVCADPQGGPSEKILSFLRPGVYQFLSQLSTFAEVVIFTAGDPEYASPLVACLDPGEKNVAASLFRESTVKTVFHDHVKDLSRLGRDPRYTVLVDNNPFSFLFQPDNGVLCEPFYGDPTDQHLHQVLLPLLKILACVNDVRPILRRRYNLAGWCSTLPWKHMEALQQQVTY